MTYPTGYIKHRKEAIAAFLVRCRSVGFTALRAFAHQDFPTGTRDCPVILMDAYENVALGRWWDEAEGSAMCFRLESAQALRERERRVS